MTPTANQLRADADHREQDTDGEDRAISDRGIEEESKYGDVTEDSHATDEGNRQGGAALGEAGLSKATVDAIAAGMAKAPCFGTSLAAVSKLARSSPSS